MNGPQIHGTAHIGPDVSLAEGVIIGHNVVIKGPCTIGENVQICPGVVIGMAGEARNIETLWTSPITIGPETVIREHVVIQRGLENFGPGTTIGRSCYIMHGVHIAHDCVLEDDVTLSPYAVLGGCTRVMEGANLGIHAATHQKTTIGPYAMVGMGAMCIRDVDPFDKVVGVPARPIGCNTRGIERAGLTDAEMDGLAVRYEQHKGRR